MSNIHVKYTFSSISVRLQTGGTVLGIKILPFLFKKCPAGNYHWRWDKYCYCMMNEYGGLNDWHGGIYSFKTRSEILVPPYHPNCRCWLIDVESLIEKKDYVTFDDIPDIKELIE